jgi:hypothetical protein
MGEIVIAGAKRRGRPGENTPCGNTHAEGEKGACGGMYLSRKGMEKKRGLRNQHHAKRVPARWDP